ncbi:MAG: hypothetical protein KBC96_03125 [Armatimonadetes bacterium]|nr:hypothetical protein [Armatimonadota bacterium]
MDSRHKEFDRILYRLENDLAGVKLLALGQTVFWDEPMKAVLRHVLDERLPETTMLIGIHDADYFSKIPANLHLSKDWEILSHNDGSTRDLWVATGEISRLFGSETIPSRELLVEHGVQIDKIGKDFPGGRSAFVDTVTEAWGWRGLVHVDSGVEVSCCVALKDALPHLMELLAWGFRESLDSLSDSDSRRVSGVIDDLLAEVRGYAESRPDASVADLFRDLLPRFYERLLGYKPRNLELTTSLDLFRFNRSTAHLSRFEPVAAFLDPATREVCQSAYDEAVADSDIFTLDRFCEGAIPFDLVIPGRGRGTICLREGEVVIDANEPIRMPCSACPTDLEGLAAMVEDHLGTDAALIGKAVTLVLMIAGEFVFVLNREGSSYIPRCRHMVGLMRERGVNLSFHPILRIGYNTWDSLKASDVTFNLPGHLAAAFGQGKITAAEFSDSWRSVVGFQEALLEEIGELSTTEELVEYLSRHRGESSCVRCEEYRQASAFIRDLSERTGPMKEESVRLKDLSHQLKQEVQRLEIEKGEHFRAAIKPLRDELWRIGQEGVSEADARSLEGRIAVHEAERAEIESRISDARARALDAQNRSHELKKAVQDLEKSPEAVAAREALKAIEREAELARAWLVRDAILTSRGLTYTGHRPAAWWFMLVDPHLKWFRRVVETADFEFEDLDT